MKVLAGRYGTTELTTYSKSTKCYHEIDEEQLKQIDLCNRDISAIKYVG